MHQHVVPDGDPALARKTRNWKLIVDPFLQKGGQKVYRTEGLVAGVSPEDTAVPHSDTSFPLSCPVLQKESLYPPVTQVRDPRTCSATTWSKVEELELKPTHFKVRNEMREPVSELVSVNRSTASMWGSRRQSKSPSPT